ncbi:MAG: RNA polymerase sigma factor SigZ [Firmicutes bacterium HGW-Firmicutes-3]|jgi:RNA polymerase sigma-70 factor (ECF subfamily)|nr:MAG: RNA polymerase sigma factor SigZ [Firmicutes bacterium HGW-Firmicutes-3]
MGCACDMYILKANKMKNIEMDVIWNKFRYELLSFIKAKVNDQHEAEDILQEVFIRIYKNIEQLEDESKLKSWLYKITNNAIIDYYRKRKKTEVQIELLENVLRYEEEIVTMNDEISTCLKLFLSDLPEKYKVPLEMYEFKEMKHKEISKELDISLSGSKTRIQRAREKLKEALIGCCKIEFDVYGNIVEYEQNENYQCSNDKCK